MAARKPEPIRVIRSRTVVLPADDVDTDQIIPARFLTTTRSDGFGDALFADWRLDAAGRAETRFRAQPAAGDMARRSWSPAATSAAGRRASTPPGRCATSASARSSRASFADIFRSNALKNGLLPIVMRAPVLAWLAERPGLEVTIDLEALTLRLPGRDPVAFEVESFARYRLLNGIDEFSYLLSQSAAIDAFERERGA